MVWSHSTKIFLVKKILISYSFDDEPWTHIIGMHNTTSFGERFAVYLKNKLIFINIQFALNLRPKSLVQNRLE